MLIDNYLAKITSRYKTRLIDLNCEVTSMPVLEMLKEYLGVAEDRVKMTRKRLVQVKKIKLNIKEYKTSELETMSANLNAFSLETLNVHRFGEFGLSIKAFLQIVLPSLTRVKHLKLNISRTFADFKISYPPSL